MGPRVTGHRWRADAVTLPAVDLGADVKVDLSSRSTCT